MAKEIPQAEKDANKIVGESNHLSNLVDDLLLLSAGETDMLSIDIRPVNIESVLISLYENYLPLVEQNGSNLPLLSPLLFCRWCREMLSGFLKFFLLF